MATRRIVLLVLGLTLALTLIPAASGSGGDKDTPSGPGDTEGRHCALGMRAVQDAPRRVLFRVTCNFAVNRLDLQTNRRIRAYSPSLRLTAPDPGDHQECGEFDPRWIVCHGETGEGVRMEGRIRVGRPVCIKPRLAVRLTVNGGMDCDDPSRVCPLIGYRASAERKRPAGC